MKIIVRTVVAALAAIAFTFGVASTAQAFSYGGHTYHIHANNPDPGFGRTFHPKHHGHKVHKHYHHKHHHNHRKA